MNTVALFWASCVVCLINMARYYSSLSALLVVLRGCDPLLYQYVDGSGFFTAPWSAWQAAASGALHLCPVLPGSSRPGIHPPL